MCLKAVFAFTLEHWAWPQRSSELQSPQIIEWLVLEGNLDIIYPNLYAMSRDIFQLDLAAEGLISNLALNIPGKESSATFLGNPF